MKQFDCHVRARAAIARRVAARRLQEGMNPVARASVGWALGKMPKVEDLLPAAFEALAAYKWPEGWGVKYSRYRIYGRPMFIEGETKDVPARVIHGIMACMRELPEFTLLGAYEQGEAAKAEKEGTTKEPTMNDVEFEETLRQDVKEAQERVARLEREENDADERCLATPLDDPDLQGYRDHSVNVSHKLEEAQLDLAKAQRWLELYAAP